MLLVAKEVFGVAGMGPAVILCPGPTSFSTLLLVAVDDTCEMKDENGVLGTFPMLTMLLVAEEMGLRGPATFNAADGPLKLGVCDRRDDGNSRDVLERIFKGNSTRGG